MKTAINTLAKMKKVSWLALSIMLLSVTCTTFSVAEESATSSYEEIDWVALMPEDDLSALMNRPEFLNDIADGSAEDSLDSFASQIL